MNDASNDMPDKIPVYDKDGKIIFYRPNFDKPGVAEEVERSAFENECAARPPQSSLNMILEMAHRNHFELEMARKYHKGEQNG